VVDLYYIDIKTAFLNKEAAATCSQRGKVLPPVAVGSHVNVCCLAYKPSEG
jgi:hypothetical protein